jgi:hypothetical protein
MAMYSNVRQIFYTDRSKIKLSGIFHILATFGAVQELERAVVS